MRNFGRKPVRYEDAPDRPPDTVIGLIWGISGDWERTVRVIAIVSCTIIALCVGLAAGIDVVMVAMRGIKFLKTSYVFPATILSGSSALTFILLLVRSARSRSPDDGKQLGRRKPKQIHEQGQRRRRWWR